MPRSPIPAILPVCGAPASIHVRIASILPLWSTPPPNGIRAPCSGAVGPISFVKRKLFSGFPGSMSFIPAAAAAGFCGARPTKSS